MACIVRTMYSVGQLYRFGNGVEKNPQEAIKWFKKAADLGHSGAKYDYGKMLFNGEGIPQDKKRAVQCWQEAARLNHAAALYELAILHTTGSFVPKNPTLAIQYFEQSAKLGNPDAHLYLAERYQARNNIPLATHHFEQFAHYIAHYEKQNSATPADIQKLANVEYKLYCIYRDTSDKWLTALLDTHNNKAENVQLCRQAKKESEKWLERASFHGHELAVPLFDGLWKAGVLETSENSSDEESSVATGSEDEVLQQKQNVYLSTVN